MKLNYWMFLSVLLLIHFESTHPILLTSAPQNINQATQNTIGLIIALGVTGFYGKLRPKFILIREVWNLFRLVAGITVLIMTVAFSSKEAKKEFLGLEERRKRSLPSDNEVLIDLALMLDSYSCLSRLLCQVEAEPELEQKSEHRLLLSLFE